MALALGYTSNYRDPVMGGHALGNGSRLYLSELMRFAQPDYLSPFGRGGIHPYTYCEDDPINHTDPSGHFSILGIGLEVLAIGLMMPSVGQAESGAIAATEVVTAFAQTATATQAEAIVETLTSTSRAAIVEEQGSSFAAPTMRAGDLEWGPALARPRELRISPARQRDLESQGHRMLNYRDSYRLNSSQLMGANMVNLENQVTIFERDTEKLEKDALPGDQLELDRLALIRIKAIQARDSFRTLSGSFSRSMSRHVSSLEEQMGQLGPRFDRVIHKMDLLGKKLFVGYLSDSEDDLSD